jgi:hypothetical protein
MNTCYRCKGKFPGPGIEKEGKLYCCDKCAKGPKIMLAKLPIMLIMAGAIFMLGRMTK